MAASTVDGAAKTGSKNIDPFKFSVQELCSLHNLKNPRAFCDFGGIDGLVDGLLSHRSRGLGGTATETTPSAPKRSSFANDAPAQLIRAFTASTRRTTAATRSTAADIAVDESAYDAALLYRRREVFLDNHLPTRKQLSFLKRLWMAYNDPVLFLLTAAAAVSLAVGLYQTFTLKHDAEHPAVEWIEGVAILVAIIIIVLVGSVNDWEKARQFKKLNEKQLERDAKVIRFGRRRVIPAADLLVGDVALLEPGDFVPADGILITGDNVTCNEASATGESDPVKKAIGDELFQALASDDNPSAETAVLSKDAFILSGTKVLEGVGTFLVTATGTNSTYGKILATLDEDTSLTPLQGRLAVLAKYIARAGLLISVLLFLGIFIRFCVGLPHDHQSPSDKGKNFVEIVIISLTVLVIAVPEGLPLAVTLSLAFATTRMMKDGNLVRSLNACETMGNATNICSDKTGTLTCNKMKVVSGVIGPVYHFYDKSEAADSTVAPSGLDAEAGIRVAEDFVLSLAPDVKTLLKQSIVLNTTAFESKSGGSFVGSTTESALLTFAKDYLGTGCVDTERSEATILQLVPFDGTRKCMATVAQDPKNQLSCRVFIKGAAEMLLSKSAEIVISPTTDASVQPLRDNDRNLLENAIKSYAGQALRLISLVYRDLKLTPDQAAKRTTSFNLKFLLQDLVFIGIMAIQDPLRPGVWKSVEDCQRAGITVRMVTGDNLLTAKAIAQQCRILSSTDPDDAAMEGSDFRALSPEQMSQKALHIKVLARSSPEDKQKLVSLLKEGGHIVAVTGDGTNDASAMSAADVSFSMGQTGTEVARQASSIIMMTDDFSCIVRAVMWGRAVNDAVKKFLQFQITITVTSVLLAFVSALSNKDEESVLTPVQLMWINLFQDTLAALALATDPPTRSVLNRKPEARTAPLISIAMWKTIIGQSLYQTAVTLILYFLGPHVFRNETPRDLQQIETLVFNAYVWLQIFNMYNSRQHDDRLNILEGVHRNWLFMAVSALMIGLQILIVFEGGRAFHAVPLTGVQWAISLGLGFLTLPLGALLRCIPDRLLERAVDYLANWKAKKTLQKPPQPAEPLSGVMTE